MQNDCSRNDRDSNIRRSEEDGETLQRVETTPATVDNCDGAGLKDNECKKEPSEEEAIALITRSWSGLLPPPEDFNAYDEQTQKSLIAWNNAQILDESRRQDETIKLAKIEGRRKGWLSFLTNIIPIVVSGVAFILTHDPNALWFLSIPCVTIGANIIVIIKNKDE